MSLITYEDVRPWARSIKNRVQSREMPPWHLDRRIGIQEFKNDPSLTDAEIATIVQWVDTGAKRGNPADMPPARQFGDADEWQIGIPDLIVRYPTYVVPAEGPDLYGNLYAPIDLEEDSATGHLISSTGDTLAFGAETVPADGVQGLFSAVFDGCRVGFIAVDRGSDTKTQGAWCDERGFVAEVTPVTPISLTSEGIAVTASSSGEQYDFFVEPINTTLLAGP